MRIRCPKSLGRIGCSCCYYSDKRETGTQIAGYSTTNNKEKDESADAREENCGVGIKAHEQRTKNGRAKHSQHMLQANKNGLSPGKPLVRSNDTFGFQSPAGQVSLSFV